MRLPDVPSNGCTASRFSISRNSSLGSKRYRSKNRVTTSHKATLKNTSIFEPMGSATETQTGRSVSWRKASLLNMRSSTSMRDMTSRASATPYRATSITRIEVACFRTSCSIISTPSPASLTRANTYMCGARRQNRVARVSATWSSNCRESLSETTPVSLAP